MEPISVGAKKCIKCGSFQDFRRFLAVGNNFLALLIALISVLSFSLPIFSKYLTKPKTNIIISYAGDESAIVYSSGIDEADLILFNEGNRMGFVTGVSLIVCVDDNTITWKRYYNFKSANNDKETINLPLAIKPNESLGVKLIKNRDFVKPPTTELLEKHLTRGLSVSIVNFDGETVETRKRFLHDKYVEKLKGSQNLDCF
jgi:hypothetical protein